MYLTAQFRGMTPRIWCYARHNYCLGNKNHFNDGNGLWFRHCYSKYADHNYIRILFCTRVSSDYKSHIYICILYQVWNSWHIIYVCRYSKQNVSDNVYVTIRISVNFSYLLIFPKRYLNVTTLFSYKEVFSVFYLCLF